mmetsp:Transcript_5903/g.10267  ORF Transcript_5903/g.10267 Transcript_5903/m.10267 type:complete len:111 (-) Transcript_5903:583-915(-)|eukprot:CAMPEP_0119104172 /NCGR_PEP_ID=MMETSP1180-20130426/2451_1 /TAXON_ID=3052 ORGANISM="Chlamydomonas cf sp, Strain CCMP681" /NCGR_SAMPLE_ID=MMETSP1180 /ASSEMBLY_ACC=CAM_ASM_000741 /LENGTH=110 /DNA_ID=CAMNT_0007088857 /DNA_START=160 /DNA_END=492 /DNA_ORIENTATION=+
MTSSTLRGFKEVKAQSSRKGMQMNGTKPAPQQAHFTGEAAVIDHDISQVEQKLRAFDFTARFGPCNGLTRLERWQQAHKFGLNPPEDVRVLLESLPSGDSRMHNVWKGRV